jgi:hypothetical protein
MFPFIYFFVIFILFNFSELPLLVLIRTNVVPFYSIDFALIGLNEEPN